MTNSRTHFKEYPKINDYTHQAHVLRDVSNTFCYLHITHISITIEKVQNEVMVNMLIKKENLQMDEAKIELIPCTV